MGYNRMLYLRNHEMQLCFQLKLADNMDESAHNPEVSIQNCVISYRYKHHQSGMALQKTLHNKTCVLHGSTLHRNQRRQNLDTLRYYIILLIGLSVYTVGNQTPFKYFKMV